MKYFLILSFQFVASCLFAQNIGQVTQGVSILQKGLWPGKTCEVCWENPSVTDVEEREMVRDAVQNSWEKESEFRFTGWGPCNINSRGIRILIADEHPRVKALGAYLDGMYGGMVLNFRWSKCRPVGSESCIRPIAVHEFGHALGFAHEHNRTDRTEDCRDDAQGTDGDWWVTGYDANSIMNYCNPVWNNGGALSELDKYGVRFLYGGSGYMTDPVVYTINPRNQLLWYKHTGYVNGTPEWASGVGSKVGDGWDFSFVVNDGDGHIYAVNKNNELLWYNHLGFHDGKYEWSDKSGTVVGSGWGDIKGVFAAGGGVMYTLRNNGDLYWHKHLGYQTGTRSWVPTGERKVGSGWNDFYAVFSGGNGVFFLVDQKGDLYWYKHAGVSDGSNKWYGGKTNKIGGGWSKKSQIFSTGAGNIYCVNKDGTLQYYNYPGFNRGSSTLENSSGKTVGSAGWDKLEVIGMGSINPDAIGNARYVDNRVTPDLSTASVANTPDLAQYSNSNKFGAGVKEAAASAGVTTNSSPSKGNDARKQIIQTRARQLNWIEFKEYVFDGANVQGAIYNNGAIFIHNNRAFETHGAIFYKWKALGGYAAIGRPITDLNTCPDGAGQYNHFKHKDGWESSIYWNPKLRKAYWVHGAIRDFWIAEGWERGPSGYPASDEKASNNNSFNRMQDFDKRQIYWSAKTGSKAVKYSTFD